MTMRNTVRTGALVAFAVVALGQAAATQPMGGPPNALQGFSVNRDKPIRITSASLEVRDKEKRATFIGNVLVAQGDTTMKSATLDVFYDQDSDGTDGKTAQAGPAAVAAPAEGQQIRRLEAKGGVVVAQKDQTATGETGVFDMRSNTVTLIGSVVITQGPQVIRGERLTVDLTSGVSHVDGGKSGVQSLFFPNQRPKGGDKTSDKTSDGKPADSKAADNADSREGRKDAPKSSTKSAPGHPMKLN